MQLVLIALLLPKCLPWVQKNGPQPQPESGALKRVHLAGLTEEIPWKSQPGENGFRHISQFMEV